MKKILVPVDFSDVSENAMNFALQLAEENKASVTFFNSVHFDYAGDYQFSSFSTTKSWMDDVQDAMQEKMDNYIQNLDTPVTVHGIVNGMYLVDAIEEMVKEEDFDVVVIGTSGCSGLEEVFIGSNAEKIVRSAPCPVIAVPKAAKLRKVKRIMVPIDLKQIKKSFLAEVSKLQAKFDATVDFLWVKTPHNIENEERVIEELTEILAANGMANATLTVERSVFPSDAILWHADDIEADIIVMPTHARRGLSHWFSGSLTEDTVNHVNIPVWTFKLDKGEASVELESVRDAHGKPEYKKIELLTVD